MSIDTLATFAIASAILLALPGPTIMLVIGYALGHGRASAWHTVPGVALGDAVAMTASLAGLGAILAASTALFAVLKWIGAAYLVYLGIKLWRAPAEAPATPVGDAGHGRKMFLHSFAVTALNPKSIVFFVAFLPQFIDHGSPLLPQFAIFEVTFVSLAALNAEFYAALAGTARETMRRPAVIRAANRIGGSLLIGAGTLVAASSRNG
ncbi:MAG: LysE family translocator [Hyphomicrobiales bacterium]|nr:LysE family translocator [Hyphomicrobiales bacterium]